jgi:hypothetical protein
LHGEKPLVHYLHTFGYVAHVKQGSKHLGKLEDRNTLMVFIRYEPGSKAWRFYNPVTLCVHVPRDAIFEEDRVWDWSEEDIGMVNRSGWSMSWLAARDRLRATLHGQTRLWSLS